MLRSSFQPVRDSRDLLRFLTAGSAEAGKSTLIAGLLRDSGGEHEDQPASMMQCSSAGGHEFDQPPVTGGPVAEREQGSASDIAPSYFSTARRKFVVAEMPEDEQSTGNLAIGASSAQAFVLVMDACQGIPPRTRRDVCIASLFGIGNLIVALNKMDLVGFDSAISEQLKRDFLQFAGPLLFPQIQFIPVSALAGDNVVARSNRMAWYEGPPLLEALESIQTCDDLGARRFRFSVQTAIRTNGDLRGYAGRIVSGGIRPGEEMLVLPSKACVTVDRIDNDQPALGEIFVSKPVVISLKEHSDPGRSEILCDPRHPLAQTKKFRARLIWISADTPKTGEPYLFRHTTQIACMSFLKLPCKTDIRNPGMVPSEPVRQDEIGEAEIETHKPVFCDRYVDNKMTGSFVVVHPVLHVTLAAGVILNTQEGCESEPAPRSADTGRGLTVWITGLSGAGKTTICQEVYTELLAHGIRTAILDGDVVRKHLSRDLGFSKAERDENVRRIGFAAGLLTRQGMVVLVSAISPYRAGRDEIRAGIGNFLEIFVNAPVDVCERRDPKGLYKKARAGQFKGFTGIDDPYEPPLSPEVECRTDLESTRESADKVIAAILRTIRTAADFHAR